MKGEADSFDQFKLLPPLFIIVFWNLSLQNKLKYKLHGVYNSKPNQKTLAFQVYHKISYFKFIAPNIFSSLGT